MSSERVLATRCVLTVISLFLAARSAAVHLIDRDGESFKLWGGGHLVEKEPVIRFVDGLAVGTTGMFSCLQVEG